MHNHSKSTDQRKVSPPRPSYMSNNQIASYLKDLRTNRPARPTGSRPYPGKLPTSTSLQDIPPRASSAFSMYEAPAPVLVQPRSGSALSHRRTISNSPESDPTGRALVQEPRTVSLRKTISPPQVFSQSVSLPSPRLPSYRENGQRRQEKEEARSLRDALQEMDLNDDIRLHHAAQDEATELVWMHQNPGMPLKNPDAPYRNPDANRDANRDSRNSERDTSVRTRKSSSTSRKSRQGSNGSSTSESQEPAKRSSMAGSLKKNLKVNFDLPPEKSEAVSAPPMFTRSESNGIFRNPNDRIYEERGKNNTNEVPSIRPEPPRTGSTTQSKPNNAFTRIPKPLPWLRDRNSDGGSVRDRISRFDIHKNPPTQSRNAAYTSNEPSPPATPSPCETPVPTKDGIEIRDDDIRAATSKRLKDRSENLPMPSAVSDKFGRPIVSFDPKWRPSDLPKPERRRASPVSVPAIEVVPSIEVSESPIPVVNVPAINEPTIAEIAEPPRQQNKSVRPLPTPQPTNRQNYQAPPRKQPAALQERWYTPYSRSGVPTAACNCCSLPISGKIVTAGGCRFHPECFTCFKCHTHLECVAFYEEPAASRAEREVNNPDGDGVPRFYCHLDFHEMFSPRCKSCKTPIEGEIVVACGAEWHVGHFFCAECGDPFNSSTPFVEKDGFAWCLRCHGRRTSSRCQGCKQLVLDDVVISAIGGQWHESCFVCHECGDGFGPDGRFFVREGEPKRTAKGRIIGGPVQLAACERCEGLRLKAPGMC